MRFSAGAPFRILLRELTALPSPLAGLKGPTSKRREGRGGSLLLRGLEGERGKGRGGGPPPDSGTLPLEKKIPG